MIVARTWMPGGGRSFPPNPPHPAIRRPGWSRRSTPDPPTPPPAGSPTPSPSSKWESALALRRSLSRWVSDQCPCAALLAVALALGRTPSRCAARAGVRPDAQVLPRDITRPNPPRPPHPATRRPPHTTMQQPVGRRARAAQLAVALAFGPTPSRCVSRRQESIRALVPGPFECSAVQCSDNLGRLANVVPRPRAALRLAGSETQIISTHVAHRGVCIEGLGRTRAGSESPL